MINLFGLFLSVSWFFVNKASKFWQKNWEAHVDLLEDDLIGPLYKTTLINKRFVDRLSPKESFQYSAGKINQLISFVVIFMWLFILVRFIQQIF
ncbi:MAG TPA: hypothetical protein VFF33_13375 [Ignavibacteriaceae bacterium]|nr:hypothetical protein [Ignavibacteriaceae bacterium]